MSKKLGAVTIDEKKQRFQEDDYYKNGTIDRIEIYAHKF